MLSPVSNWRWLNTPRILNSPHRFSIRSSEIVKLAITKKLLAQAGFLLRKRNSGDAFLGSTQLDYSPEGATVQSNTIIGTPLYEAGLDRRDLIKTLDGEPLTSEDVWQRVLDTHQPGDVIEVEYHQRGQQKTAQLTFIEDPRLEVVLYEDAGMNLDEAQRTFREQWLGEK